MFVPQIYFVALLMTVLSMICWGSWSDTPKRGGQRGFERLYSITPADSMV